MLALSSVQRNWKLSLRSRKRSASRRCWKLPGGSLDVLPLLHLLLRLSLPNSLRARKTERMFRSLLLKMTFQGLTLIKSRLSKIRLESPRKTTF